MHVGAPLGERLAADERIHPPAEHLAPGDAYGLPLGKCLSSMCQTTAELPTEGLVARLLQ